MKQPIYFFLLLALVIVLTVVVLNPDLLLRRVLGGSVRSLDEFARDEGAPSFEAWLGEHSFRKLEEEEDPALQPGY